MPFLQLSNCNAWSFGTILCNSVNVKTEYRLDSGYRGVDNIAHFITVNKLMLLFPFHFPAPGTFIHGIRMTSYISPSAMTSRYLVVQVGWHVFIIILYRIYPTKCYTLTYAGINKITIVRGHSPELKQIEK